MAAAATDKFRKGTNNFSTTLSAGIGASDTTISLASATNLPTDTGIDLVIDRVDTNGNKTPALREYVKGVVSGTTLISVVRGIGNSTAQIHAIGAVVEFVYDQNTLNDMVDGITVQHNQDGIHGAVTATTVTTPFGGITEGAESLLTMRSQYLFDHVASGCVITGTGYGSTLAWSMTSGVVFIGGKPLTVAAATGTVTASKDTYFDLLDPGSGTTATLVNTGSNIVTNNAASPALAASSLRIGIVVSGANIAAATSINQGQETMVLPIASSSPYSVTDSLGNLICPRDPNRRVLGYRQATVANTATTPYGVIPQLSVPVIVPTGRRIKITLWSRSASTSAGAGTALYVGIFESTTLLAEAASIPAAANYATNPVPIYQGTPSAGSHTYLGKIKTDSGTVSIAGDPTYPTFMLVELD